MIAYLFWHCAYPTTTAQQYEEALMRFQRGMSCCPQIPSSDLIVDFALWKRLSAAQAVGQTWHWLGACIAVWQSRQ